MWARVDNRAARCLYAAFPLVSNQLDWVWRLFSLVVPGQSRYFFPLTFSAGVASVPSRQHYVNIGLLPRWLARGVTSLTYRSSEKLYPPFLKLQNSKGVHFLILFFKKRNDGYTPNSEVHACGRREDVAARYDQGYLEVYGGRSEEACEHKHDFQGNRRLFPRQRIRR